ncbi:DUF6223 family protein [Streptomyces sp. WMMC500]|uniref:DUF6223 family protein n=1 Tax=Streptomyces sp. WMMC500 TaxID=3015154 RepID=UPI00248D2D50|nr:DUF6223 family protein [Streptomyces sp. WMMC500]WBB62421.1 DUF6223 family protein [Streptomyces sp. WMMC500]
MSVRHLFTAAAAAVLGILVCAAPAAAHVPVAAESDDGSGRGPAMAATILALIGVVLAGLALARKLGSGLGGPLASVVASAVGVVIGVVALAGSDDVGSGSGRGGAIVALLLGLVGLALGGLALARARRAVSA